MTVGAYLLSWPYPEQQLVRRGHRRGGPLRGDGANLVKLRMMEMLPVWEKKVFLNTGHLHCSQTQAIQSMS